jgi:phosphatidylglycerol:prolipoprotein diacylglycerol transferase
MFNNWFTIGGITIHGYGVMTALGMLAACWVGERQAKKHGLRSDLIVDIVLWAVLIGYMGSKLLYVIVEWKTFLQDPWSVLGSSGFVVYGGILAGVAAVYGFCRIKHLDFRAYFNLLMPAVALAQGFGRIGCFCAGCCYGRVTTSPLGVEFPVGSLAPAGVKILPTQLFSSAGDFAIFAILYWNYNHGKHPEDTGAWYLVLYSIGRFLIEFLRADERGAVGFLSTSQFLALFMLAAGLYLLWKHRGKRAKAV